MPLNTPEVEPDETENNGRWEWDEIVPLVLIVVYLAGRLVLVMSLCAIVGYSFVAPVISFVGPESWLSWAPGFGWTAGLLVGIAAGVSDLVKLLRKSRRENQSNPVQKIKQKTSDSFFPGKPVKAVLVVGLLMGTVMGGLLALFMISVLIAVSTCPLAPESWHPSYSPPENHSTAGTLRQNDGDSGVSFQHPLMGPIAIGSVSTSVVVFTILSIVFYRIANSTKKGRANAGSLAPEKGRKVDRSGQDNDSSPQ